MSELRQVKLSDICNKPTYGAIASGGDQHDGPLFVRQTDLSGGRINWSSVPRCDLDSSQVLKYVIERDDILVSRLGTVGRSARVTETHGAVYAGYLVRFQVDPTQADPAFVAYQLQSPQWWAHVDASRSGAVQPTLNAKQMAAFEFELPNMDSQKAIAAVLGALDDKIAANTRLAITVDQLMRNRYLALDVDGVDTLTIGDLADNVRAQSQPEDVAPHTPYVGLEHVPRRHMFLEEMGGASDVASAKASFKVDDILFGKLRPYFHKVVAAPVSGICSTDMLVLRARKSSLSGFVLAAVSSDSVIAQCSALAQGTRMPRTNWKDLSACEVLWPGPDTARAMSRDFSDLAALVAAKNAESRRLAQTRDSLLPLLMSGTVTVKDAEQVVEEAV